MFEAKQDDAQQSDFEPRHWLSQLHTIKSNDTFVFGVICDFLDVQSLCRLSGCGAEFDFVTSSEYIWRPRCLSRWPELKMAKNLEDDPFPIYKSCYKRKATEEGTSMQDLMKIFGLLSLEGISLYLLSYILSTDL